MRTRSSHAYSLRPWIRLPFRNTIDVMTRDALPRRQFSVLGMYSCHNKLARIALSSSSNFTCILLTPSLTLSFSITYPICFHLFIPTLWYPVISRAFRSSHFLDTFHIPGPPTIMVSTRSGKLTSVFPAGKPGTRKRKLNDPAAAVESGATATFSGSNSPIILKRETESGPIIPVAIEGEKSIRIEHSIDEKMHEAPDLKGGISEADIAPDILDKFQQEDEAPVDSLGVEFPLATPPDTDLEGPSNKKAKKERKPRAKRGEGKPWTLRNKNSSSLQIPSPAAEEADPPDTAQSNKLADHAALEAATPNAEALIATAPDVKLDAPPDKKAKKERKPRTPKADQKPKGPKKTKKRFGESPWPDLEHPTREECAEVNRRLTKAHGVSARPEKLVVNNSGLP